MKKYIQHDAQSNWSEMESCKNEEHIYMNYHFYGPYKVAHYPLIFLYFIFTNFSIANKPLISALGGTIE